MTFTKVTNTGIGSTGTVLLQNLDVIGIATAGFGVSTVDVFTTGITTFANATDSTSSTTGSVIVSGGVGIAGSLNVGGSVSVGGTLTYEDVTNIDSVGIITARSNILVGSGITLSPDGDVFTTGVSTFSSNIKVGSGITLSPDGNYFATGISTVSDKLFVNERVRVTGPSTITNMTQTIMAIDSADDNTIGLGGKIGLCGLVNGTPRTYAAIGGLKAADGTSHFGGNLALYTRRNNEGTLDERLRITSDGKFGFGTDNPSNTIHMLASGGECVIELQRDSTNTTGNVGAINFTASDGHSVASIGAYGGGDNESAYINFKTTTAASANSPFTSTTERMKISADGYVSGNINVPAWFGQQDTAQTVANGTWTTVVNLGNSVTNPSMNNGGWDESAGTFTVQAGQAGTYYVFGQAGIDDIQGDDVVRAGISKNNANPAFFGECRSFVGEANQIYQAYIAMVITVAVGDTIRLKVYHTEGTNELTEQNRTYFGGYRIAT